MDGAAPGAKLVSARACNFGAGCTAVALTDGMVKLVATAWTSSTCPSVVCRRRTTATTPGPSSTTRSSTTSGVQIVISAGNSSNAPEHHRRPVGGHRRGERRRRHHQGDLGGELRLGRRLQRVDHAASPRAARVRTVASSRTSPPRVRPSPPRRCGCPAPRSPRPATPCRPATRCCRAPRWRPRRRPARWRCCSRPPRPAARAASPPQLRRAVYSSAVWNDSIPAFLQGRGQIDVPAAWDLPAEPRARSSRSTAPVCTEVWNDARQDRGTGLYNRCAAIQGARRTASSGPTR